MKPLATTETRMTQTLVGDCSGIVFVEFLLAFVPLWVFFLCLVQLALLARADLIVKHAADAAARSAAVVLPDDPNEYGGEPTMSLDRNPIPSAGLARALEQIARFISSPNLDSLTSALSSAPLVNAGRSRLNTIRLAVYVALTPLAPSRVRHHARPSLREAIGGKRRLLNALIHHPFAASVTFPAVAGSVVSGPEITVRVVYAYPCAVPLARRLLCGSFDDLASHEDYEQALLPVLGRFSGGYFRELRHESTLMIHDAPYRYRARGS